MTARKSRRKPYVSNADFKARIAGIMRGSDSETSAVVYHPPKVLPSIVRLPSDRGFFPPSREIRDEK